jgi:hypothetical protein
MINARYVAKLMSQEWGFCYTSTTNLNHIKQAVEGVGALSEAQCRTICEQVDLLLKYIEEAPKSNSWNNRAKVGNKKPWYKEIADWE